MRYDDIVKGGRREGGGVPTHPNPAQGRREATPPYELLRLLLLNVGLLEVVKLVPEERWREALARVYGSGG